MCRYLCPRCFTEVYPKEIGGESLRKCSTCESEVLNPIILDDKTCWSCKNFFLDKYFFCKTPHCRKGINLYLFVKGVEGLLMIANICKYYENKKES